LHRSRWRILKEFSNNVTGRSLNGLCWLGIGKTAGCCAFGDEGLGSKTRWDYYGGTVRFYKKESAVGNPLIHVIITDELILTGRLYFEYKNYRGNEAVLGAPRVHVTWPHLISIMVSAYHWSRQRTRYGANKEGQSEWI
jgi:hypothetical protein